jgi:hypothetical protein
MEAIIKSPSVASNIPLETVLPEIFKVLSISPILIPFLDFASPLLLILRDHKERYRSGF